jgi:shikimate kinase
MELHNTIIYLIGIPAVGKYTVAREIGRMTGAKVVDNESMEMLGIIDELR